MVIPKKTTLSSEIMAKENAIVKEDFSAYNGVGTELRIAQM